MTGKEKSNALMCDMALELKSKVFAVKRGNGEKYMNFNLMYNPQGTGYMQQLRPVENYIFDVTEKFMQENNDKPYNKAAFDKLYSDIFTEIEAAYKKF